MYDPPSSLLLSAWTSLGVAHYRGTSHSVFLRMRDRRCRPLRILSGSVFFRGNSRIKDSRRKLVYYSCSNMKGSSQHWQMGLRSQPICQAIYVLSYSWFYCCNSSHLVYHKSHSLAFVYVNLPVCSSCRSMISASTTQMLQITYFEIVLDQLTTNRLSVQSYHSVLHLTPLLLLRHWPTASLLVGTAWYLQQETEPSPSSDSIPPYNSTETQYHFSILVGFRSMLRRCCVIVGRT